MDFRRSATKWKRVSRRQRCPICDHPDWCLFAGPAAAPEAAICARVESWKRCGEAGWLHRLRDEPFRLERRTRRFTIGAPAAPPIDVGTLATECEAALGPHRRGLLAAELGVTPDSLAWLRVGWSARDRASTWPMMDAAGTVRGIRLRAADGRKWSVRGGREGLFLAGGRRGDDTLLVCEGGTDTAALLGLGLCAVGRPSCTGGVGLLLDAVCDWQPAAVAIVADGDAPGQRGARYLASRLVGYVASGVRIVTPPAKDAREWVKRGATRDDVRRATDGAPALTLAYARRALA